MCVVRVVEKFLRSSGMAPTRFGRNAVGDPRLVFDMRKGRELRPETAARVLAYVRSASMTRNAGEGSHIDAVAA